MLVVKKFNRPTVFDHAPYGTKWIAEPESGQELYIQISMDENVAQWSKLGDFLEKMCTEEIIEDLLQHYARRHAGHYKD